MTRREALGYIVTGTTVVGTILALDGLTRWFSRPPAGDPLPGTKEYFFKLQSQYAESGFPTEQELQDLSLSMAHVICKNVHCDSDPSVLAKRVQFIADYPTASEISRRLEVQPAGLFTAVDNENNNASIQTTPDRWRSALQNTKYFLVPILGYKIMEGQVFASSSRKEYVPNLPIGRSPIGHQFGENTGFYIKGFQIENHYKMGEQPGVEYWFSNFNSAYRRLCVEEIARNEGLIIVEPHYLDKKNDAPLEALITSANSHGISYKDIWPYYTASDLGGLAQLWGTKFGKIGDEAIQYGIDQIWSVEDAAKVS